MLLIGHFVSRSQLTPNNSVRTLLYLYPLRLLFIYIRVAKLLPKNLKTETSQKSQTFVSISIKTKSPQICLQFTTFSTVSFKLKIHTKSVTVYVVKDILLKNSMFVLIYLSFYWKLVVCKVRKSFCCMIPLIIVCNFFDPYFILYLFVIVLLMFFSRKNFTMASNEQANDVYEMVFKDRLKARSFEHLNI